MTPKEYGLIASNELRHLDCEEWLTLFDLGGDGNRFDELAARAIEQYGLTGPNNSDSEFYMLPEKFRALDRDTFMAYCRMRARLMEWNVPGLTHEEV